MSLRLYPTSGEYQLLQKGPNRDSFAQSYIETYDPIGADQREELFGLDVRPGACERGDAAEG